MADKLPPELSWSDHEKEQTWVPRYDEKRMETALWRYCVSRHKQRWAGTKRQAGPPTSYSEGKGIGWWFPKLWTKEFKPGTTSAVVARPRSTNPLPEADWNRPWPELKEFRRWNLPVGTQIVAADATVIYPNGVVEGWASVQRRARAQMADKAPEPSTPQAPTEEPAVTPSPQLVEAVKRKEWLAKVARGEVSVSDAADPDAWRSEMTNTNA
jgi:hypothetical protein